MASSRHVLWSIGSRNDYPPHEHRWCTRCGEAESFGLPKDLDVVILEGNKFVNRHKNCIKTADNFLGYLHYYGNRVWGGAISIEDIARAAFNAAINIESSREPYRVPEYNKKLAVAAIEEMIACKFEVSRQWFSLNYGELLGYKNQESHEKVWPGMRFSVFLNTAYGLLKEKY